MPELASLIARNARYRPDDLAVVFEDQRLTWRAFDERVGRVANMLRALGIKPGDHVATVLPNSLESLELIWAVPAIGAALVPLSPLLMPAGLAGLLRDSDAKCVVTQRAMIPTLEAIGESLPPHVLLIDGAHGAFADYGALSASARPEYTPAAVSEDALFNIMYTSGTTGLPKGIMHTHRIRSTYCTVLASAFRFTPEVRALHTGAIVFNGAYVTLMPTFWLGGTYVLARQFDVEQMIATLERERITHIIMVPAQIIQMLASPRFDPARLDALECIISVGAPLHQEHKDRLNALLPDRFYELYGLTEGFITILDRRDAARKSSSVGIPAAFNDMRIVGEDGRDLPAGEIGEIVGRGPFLMTGYYKRPDLTAQAVRDGWLYTGDMGYADDDGFLHLVDRKKDMIDSGGVKVYPKDVEEVAAQHPDVLEVAVFGVPHDKWGETPVAAVILKHEASASAEVLREWINERVSARYQRVSQVVVMEAFPRSAAGKTLKREMREPYWAGRERKI